jgi:hypothetical protein
MAGGNGKKELAAAYLVPWSVILGSSLPLERETE